MSATTIVPPRPPYTNSRPVPRELVHKAAHSEVLLTGWRQTGVAEWEVTAQWPRDHGYWRTRGGRQDPMLMAETARQALPLLSHAVYGMPAGHQLIWEHFSCRFAVPFLKISERPAEVTLRVAAAEAPQPGRRFRRASLTMDIACDGIPLGTSSSVYTAHPPEVYRRLRGPSVPTPEEMMAKVGRLPVPDPVEPRSAGRELARDVVLAPAPEPGQWELRVDVGHPWLFDHPVDHAPGMLLLEAARQAAHAVAVRDGWDRAPALAGLDVTFDRYVEMDKPCRIALSPGRAPAPDGAEQFRIACLQDGRAALTGLIEVARPVA